MTLPAEGIHPWYSVDSFMQRGTSPLEIWHFGSVNQSALITVAPTLDRLYMLPLVLPGGVIDGLAFEVTAGVANSVARAGIYRNTSDHTLYPSTLVVDGGEKDCSTNGVKSTTGLTAVISPGLYWLALTMGVAAATLRAHPQTSMSHLLGVIPTLGANAVNTIWFVDRAYSALPGTAPAGGAFFQGSSRNHVFFRFAS